MKMSNPVQKKIRNEVENYVKETGKNPDVILVRDSMIYELEAAFLEENTFIASRESDTNDRTFEGILIYIESEGLELDWRGYSILAIGVEESDIIAVMMAYNMKDGLNPITREIIEKMKIDEQKLYLAMKRFANITLGVFYSDIAIRRNISIKSFMKPIDPKFISHQNRFQKIRKSKFEELLKNG